MTTTRVPQQHPFLAHASDIASYYGFRPLKELNPELFREQFGRAPASFVSGSLMCASCARAGTTLAYWAAPSVSHQPPEIPSRESGEFSLQISGCSQSTAEIIILKTLVSIVSEWGTPISCVRVNAFGDRDSRERFARELGAYFRRRLSGSPEEEYAAILAEPTRAYESSSPLILELLQEAPRPVHYLSEKSRTHFREFLDYLEQVNLPYELDDTIGSDEREPRILFRLVLENADELILGGSGGRFDDFVARLAGKRDTTAVSGSIYFRKKGTSPSSFRPDTAFEPKMYFVQLGLRAKLRGLSVVDALRRAQIPVAQSFDSSKLSPQLEAARNAGVSHLIIMGEREAIDGTVIVRAMNNSSQTIVELPQLSKFLRTLRI